METAKGKALYDGEETPLFSKDGKSAQNGAAAAAVLRKLFPQRSKDDDDYENDNLKKRDSISGSGSGSGNIKIFLCLGIAALLMIGLVVFRNGSFFPSEMLHHTRFFVMPHAFSDLNPVLNLQVMPVKRPAWSDPSLMVLPNTKTSHALPTNIWYQSLLLVSLGDEPTDRQSVFTVPFRMDMVGPIPGLHVFPEPIQANATVVHMSSSSSSFNDAQHQYGMTLGIHTDTNLDVAPQDTTHQYLVTDMTPLGLTVQWEAAPMTSSIVRGMPYATMHYPMKSLGERNAVPVLPTLLAESPILLQDGETNNVLLQIDGETIPLGEDSMVVAQGELGMTLENGLTWLVFFSEPVRVGLLVLQESKQTMLQVKELLGEQTSASVLTVRAGLVTTCADAVAASSTTFCKDNQKHPVDAQGMAQLLRDHANVYPGSQTSVRVSVENDAGVLFYDWDAQTMRPSFDATDLIAYAMPHHLELLGEVGRHCVSSPFGTCCIVRGSEWSLPYELPRTSFWATVPPSPYAIGDLATSLKTDIHFELPEPYRSGGGNTYFSAKMLAKLARILLIAEELLDVCNQPDSDYQDPCMQVRDELPTPTEMSSGVTRLRESLEIWFNESAMTPFVYDPAWGGIVSCGCDLLRKNITTADNKTTLFETCTNRFPNCVAIEEFWLDFGNAYYNDHHFHYGYFIYTAAAVAHFDPVWARNHFDKMMLLVRDIANPSVEEDQYFPLARHKDWYRGHSWAGGIAPPTWMNGRNQESSSEAINAYEGISLFGQEMAKAWQQVEDGSDNVAVSERIRDTGKMLLAMELQSVDKYYHVRNNSTIYPEVYQERVVGIVWSVKAIFTTWFSPRPYTPYGIQLLPLTVISGQRDEPDWTHDMYPKFARVCNDYIDDCQTHGWSILELAIFAEVGYPQEAIRYAMQLPPHSFVAAGGNGHSLTNTIWYMATRPAPPVPLTNLPPIAIPRIYHPTTNTTTQLNV